MKLGIFGGTFDPPHVGHLILAAEACSQLGLDRLLWVLTAQPPHKQDQAITPLANRLSMLQSAIYGEPSFVLSRVDIDRRPPHYALDTVRMVQEDHPTAQLVYIMGGDSLHDLPTWHNPLDFLDACHQIGVMRRPGDRVRLDNLERILPGITAKVRFIEAPLLEISSSEIRERIEQGRPYRYYLPEAVYQYIRSNWLYASPAQRPEAKHAS